MICADFLAGANLNNGDPETLLFSMTRFFKFLPGEQRQEFLERKLKVRKRHRTQGLRVHSERELNEPNHASRDVDRALARVRHNQRGVSHKYRSPARA